MTVSIDLNHNYLATVERILAEHVPECEVRAFGSRATWTAKDYSDLDLAVVGKGPLDRRTLGRLKESFEESNLPMRVDVLDWHTISESFQREIGRDYVVVQEGAKQEPADDWREVALGDLIDIKHGYAFKGAFIHDEPVGDVLLTPGNFAIGGGFQAGKTKHYNGMVPDEFVLSEDDLLVTMTDLSKRADTLGYPALVPASQNGVRFLHNQRLGKVTLRDTESVDMRFLYYVLCSKEYRDEILASATGTTVKHTSPERIRRYRFLLPLLPTQLSIAQVLGTLDDKIELNRRMNETLEEMARALFKSWFVDFEPVRAKMEGRWHRGESLLGLPAEYYDLFPDRMVDSELGDVPEGWEVGALGDCFNLTMGQSPPGSTYNDNGDGTPFYQGSTDFGERYPTNRRYCTEPARLAQTEDTLVSVRAPVGAINRAWERCCIGRGVAALRHKSGSAVYTYYAIWTAQPEIRQYEHTGTVFGAIGGQQFRALLMLEPPGKTIAGFHRIGQDLDSRIRFNVDESRALAAQRDALLPRLLSGEVDVVEFS